MSKKPSSKKFVLKIGQDLPNEAEKAVKVKSDTEDLQQQQIAWDVYKENILPISQGRNFGALMETLPLITDNKSRKQLFETRKNQFDTDLETHKGDLSRQLDLWCDYIDWLEQNVPDGGKVNGVTNAIEQCIELFYDKKEFKQDKRLFDVFMKFKRFCDEPIEIFSFMYANSICTLLSRFYLNWSWQYEIKKNMKRAEDLIKLGIKNLATPRDVLLESQEQLKYRIARMIRAGELDDCPDLTGPLQQNTRETQAQLANSGIRAALQTLKFKVTKNAGLQVPINRIGEAVEQVNVGGLKSQTKVVNGVRVPNTKVKNKLRPSNKPVLVFSEDQENPTTTTTMTTANNNMTNGGENADATSSGLAHLLATKVPTSQRIQLVGRTGSENQQPHFGAISLKK